MTKNKNLRKEIITLIRGYFLTPVIATLAKKNFLKKNKSKFLNVKSHSEKIFINYLKNLGYITQTKNKYLISKSGKKLFLRSGSFNIVNSYRDYILNLDKILDNPKILDKIDCDRKENILGSGSTNYRKFFKPALNLLKDNDFDIIHDLGCGDGNFLKKVKLQFKDKKFSGSDLSKIAVRETKKNLNLKNLKLIQSDAMNVKKWTNFLLKEYDTKNQKLLITIWFIVHEISKKDVFRIIDFFKAINKRLPNAKILLGEIVEPDKKLLKENIYNTIMPEYIFFHQLSGQGIFTLKELKFILNEIPFKCTKRINVDSIKFRNKENPSGIVWMLEPKN